MSDYSDCAVDYLLVNHLLVDHLLVDHLLGPRRVTLVFDIGRDL